MNKSIIEIIELDAGWMLIYNDASIEYLTNSELKERMEKAA